MRARRLWMALATLLALSLLTTASAGKYGYAVDVDAMKAAEAADPFPVRVIERKVVEESFSVDLFENADDALVITVENGSQDAVAAVKVGFVAYDKDGVTVEVTGELTPYTGLQAEHEIYTLNKDGLSVAPGGRVELVKKVDYSRLHSVRAMVAEYTTESGETVVNPSYAQWQNLAYGLTAGNVTELD